uniref:Integrase catalytic domain-containing protein n=1 Tax=Fagus sylvatica TaxID=28930 RepID=A0A2N9ER04_FAGSY
MHDDLIGEYETFQNAKDMWDQLKFDFGGTSTTRLRSLVLKFEVYRKDPKHTMTEHLRMMSWMIRDLKDAGNVLTDEQQVQARQEATKFAALIAHGGQRKPNGFKRKDKGKAARQGGPSTSAPKVNKDTGATRHVARDRAGFVDYRKIPAGTHVVYMGNGSYEEALGVGSYQLHLCTGHTLLLHDFIYMACPTGAHRRKIGWPGKACRKPFGKAVRATQSLELIHSDICGPMNVKARHGASYFLTFIDDYTRYGYVQLIAHRYEALDCFKRFVAEVENQHEKSLKALRTDRGRDYLSDQFKDLCEEKGDTQTTYYFKHSATKCQFPPPHTNFGKAKSPIWKHLRPWGSAGFVHSTTHKYGKLGPRARKHIFIRYSDSSKGYVMYGEHPNGGMTEIESRDIDFIETDFPSIGEANRDLDLYELEEDEGTLPSSSEGGGLVPRPVITEDSGSGLQPSGSITLDQDSQARRVSSRGHIPRLKRSIHQDRDEWMTAMQEEMSSMDKNNVWELVDLPPGRKTIGNKWVLKVKRKADGSIDRYKARLVAKGYTQREGIDYEDTFSPVVRFASIRLILSIVAKQDLELFQMDVKTAFLNGELDEEIYMAQPAGFEVQGHERKMIEEDHCMYLKRSKRSILILSLYVDDILLAGNDMDSIVTTKKWLSSTFEMKDMGEANFVLGVKITRDRSKKLLSLSQGTYIKKILECFHMHNSKSIDTPMEKGCTLSLDQCPKNDEEKNQISAWLVAIRAILGLAHWRAVKRILRYLRGTIDHALCYHGKDLRLTCVTAMLIGPVTRNERKSTSGYAFILRGGAVSWCSKKQSCIALSTMESEYVACSAAVQEAVWLRRFLQRLGVTAHAEDAVLLYYDSTSALAYAKDPKYHGEGQTH